MLCDGIVLKRKWRLRNGFVTFCCFKYLEKREITLRVNFEFFLYYFSYRWWYFEKKQKKLCLCDIVLWYVIERALIILRLFLSRIKANRAAFWKSKVWLVIIFWEIKEFVVLPVVKSFLCSLILLFKFLLVRKCKNYCNLGSLGSGFCEHLRWI